MKTIYLSYSRVSTNEQFEKGVSIEAQIEEHQIWAEKHGVEINAYFVDRGYSAGSFKRPGLQEMIGLISKNKKTENGFSTAFVIIIRYQSRLIRDVTKKRSLQCVFDKYNTRVVCLSGMWMGKPNEGGIVSDIQMLFDENERKQVSERVFDSYRHIAMAGGYPVGGRIPPRGYKRERIGKMRRLVPNHEAPIVKELFELLATGNFTMQEACELFNAKKVLNKIWNLNTLSKIIDNPIYYGRLKTNYFDSDDPSIEEAQKAGWFSLTCHCEPLISRETYEKVQIAMHRKKKRTEHNYFFDNKVICANCGNKLIKKCAWRKIKSTGKYKLYKYYYCESCNKRINESFIMEQFLAGYPKWERYAKNSNFMKLLQNKIISRHNQISILNQLYEESAIDDEEYQFRLRSLSKDIKLYRSQYKKSIEERELDWDQFSDEQKMEFVKSVVECIYVFPGPIDEGAKIKEIQYKASLPIIKKIRKIKK